MTHKKGSALAKATKQKPIPVKIVSDTPTSKPSYVEEDKKWRAESDLRTLKEAAQIKCDRERMKAAKSCAKEQMKALSKIK